MADVKWIKIVTDIFDDEKILLIETMPESDSIIVIWFKLLCLAGKQNNSGVFLLNGRIPYTEEMLAGIFRRPLNTVRMALKTFEQFGMIEIINHTITIPNWGKHQSLDSLENKREYMRKYMRAYREKQKALSSGENCDENGSNANCKTNSEDNVSSLDIDKNKNKNKSSGFGARAPARTRVEHNHNDDYTPYDDETPDAPDLTTLEAYAANNIMNMYNGYNMEKLLAFRDDLPDDLIRFGIDMANKYCKTGVPTYAYVESILKGFVKRKLMTVEQAKAAEEARQAKKEPKPQTAQTESKTFWDNVPFY